MLPIATIATMIGSAANIVGAFQGGAAQAKTSSTVQDAIEIIKSLVPLVEAFGGGKDVTAEDVKRAMAGKDAALAELDAEIARRKAEQEGAPDADDAA